MSSFSGINVALRALLSNQAAIQVIQHNVANANTPGYSRQEAILAAALPSPLEGMNQGARLGQLGTGVVVDHIRRYSQEFYQSRLRQELSSTKQWEATRDLLEQVEISLSETTSDGLIPKLDGFWTAWQSLSASPDDTIVRIDLKQRAQDLVDAFNRRAIELRTIRENEDLFITQLVNELNDAASQVAALNAEITRVKAVGQQPNDLLDQRGRLLDRLAELGGAISFEQDNGDMMVSIGGHALVVGDHTFSLEAAPDPSNDNLVSIKWENGQAFNAVNGELKGILESRDVDIPILMSGLDNLASTLINRINTLHQTGYGMDNQTSLDFFSGSDALSIRLSSDIDDPASIASAAAINTPGDGSIASQIAEVSNELLMDSGTTTINQYYSGQIASLGLKIQQATRYYDDRKLVADQLENIRQSSSGVSLDEEAANLIKYQHAFQAATRLMTTIDSMLDRIINSMGMVGR